MAKGKKRNLAKRRARRQERKELRVEGHPKCEQTYEEIMRELKNDQI